MPSSNQNKHSLKPVLITGNVEISPNVFVISWKREGDFDPGQVVKITADLKDAPRIYSICSGNQEENISVLFIKDGYIRLVITRGVGDLGLAPWLCPKPSLFIIASKISLYPQEHYDNGLEHRHGADAPHRARRAAVDRQVAELPQQHPRQDRGPAGRRARGHHAQRAGLRRGVHRRQHLHRLQGRDHHARPPRRARSRASPAPPSSTSPRSSASR